MLYAIKSRSQVFHDLRISPPHRTWCGLDTQINMGRWRIFDLPSSQALSLTYTRCLRCRNISVDRAIWECKDKTEYISLTTNWEQKALTAKSEEDSLHKKFEELREVMKHLSPMAQMRLLDQFMLKIKEEKI